jgi:two-component system sensor histidine kinase BaeS
VPGDTSTVPPPPGAPVRRPTERPVATVRQVALVAAAGLTGAALLPYRPPGVAMALTAFVVGALVLTARRRSSVSPSVWHRAFAGLAFGLAVLPAVTDAAWVLAVTVPASAGLAVLAVGGGRTWRGAIAPAFRVIEVTFTGIAAAGRAMTTIVPVRSQVGRHLRTAGWTVALLLVFGSLFRSGDAAFAGLLDAVLPEVSLEGLIVRTLVGAVIASGTLTLVLLRVRPEDDAVRPPARTASSTEWIVPLAALVALFATFVLVQLGTLFGGDAVVQRTAGLTYAAYAREGFGQLLTAAALTLGVVAVAGRYADPADAREERLRRGLLAALCGLTLVVLASSFQRLSLYEATFGFTRDRITAHATILWLGVVFVLVLVIGALRRTALLPRAVTAWTGIALLVFGLAQPDALVARGNVARFETTGDIDPWVLSDLSDDAVPVLVSSLPADLAACVVGPRAAAPSDPLAWNLARSRAEAARAALPTASCHPGVLDRWSWAGDGY